MTVCIAAHALWKGQERLVLGCDWQVGDDYSTWESPDKFELSLGEHLCALCSGQLEDCQDLMTIYKRRLGSRELNLPDLKEEMVVGMKEFKSDLSRTGRRSKTDAQLLVTGFVEGVATILFIEEKSVSRVPFGVIGTGAGPADAILRWRMAKESFDPFSSLHDVVYCVYEAKRFGELSPHVGKRITEIIVVGPSGTGHLNISITGPDHIEFLAGEFGKYGPQPLPKDRGQFPNFPDVVADTGSHSGSDP
jgi:hypothetical protein